jgi:hypothetical protein
MTIDHAAGDRPVDAVPRDATLCATPLGLVPPRGLANLSAFGEQMERVEYPYIDVGGFIVPGRAPAVTNQPGKESHRNGAASGTERKKQSPREKAGSSARPWPRPAEAAPGAAPHAVERRLTTLNLDLPVLVAFHPLTRVVASTEAVVHLNLPLGVVPELPIGARLTLEVPLMPRERLRQTWAFSGVPDVRAWAVWEGGPSHGQLVVSHHQNPDQAICASMPGEWMLREHALHDYVAFCVLWVAKALHERLFGFYPGPQHYPAAMRVQRDRPDEFCGCGKQRRYRHCCRDRDRAQQPYALWREAHLARVLYMGELARQGRPAGPPERLLRLGLLLG